MPSRDPAPLYRVLFALLGLSVFYQAGVVAASIHILRNATSTPRTPLQFGFRGRAVSGLEPNARAAGIQRFDRIETVDGQPFTGVRVLDRIVSGKRAGGTITIAGHRYETGAPFTAVFSLASQMDRPVNLTEWLVTMINRAVMPALCLLLGFWVAFARPRDPAAWFLLGLMIGFSQFALDMVWDWPVYAFADVWHNLLGNGYGAWLVWLVAFTLVFPERLPFEVRRPWLKWVVLVPLIAQALFWFLFSLFRDYDFDALVWLQPVLRLFLAFPLYIYLSFTAIAFFFALINIKRGRSTTPDARRRLSVLYFGTSLSLTPMFIVAIIALVRGMDMMASLPAWADITALLFLAMFPLTLAYVIIVQRAMKVSVVLRQGLQYALARRGLAILRGALFATALAWTVNAFGRQHPSTMERTASCALLAAAVIVRRTYSTRASNWIDRRFFREAYSAEQVLAEIGEEARRFTSAGPLLNTVARRISDTLHCTGAAVLLNDGGRFCVSETVGLDAGSRACLAPQAESLKLLSSGRPELVYFDDPRSWVHDAAPEEQQSLRDLRAEVLLALPGRSGLLGLIALGPKKSEEPYSPSDLRLLQTVAMHTGLALENSLLLERATHETAMRERLNREIEIARDVQQRLFPQTIPPLPGFDYFGLCRPALAVGGDYFDFLPLPSGRLGIAVGDVSGKGISAALMMASVHSLLRGQTTAGLDDLGKLVSNTNRLIFDASKRGRFITLFYAELNPATGTLAYVNAGHNPPAVLRGDETLWLRRTGPAVGLLRGAAYEVNEVRLEPGEILLVYTDGISEAMDDSNQEFGEDRFIRAARRFAAQPARQMIDTVIAATDEFCQDAPQHDDMTLVVIKALTR